MIVKNNFEVSSSSETSSFETVRPESGKIRKKNPLKSMDSLSVKYLMTFYIS